MNPNDITTDEIKNPAQLKGLMDDVCNGSWGFRGQQLCHKSLRCHLDRVLPSGVPIGAIIEIEKRIVSEYFRPRYQVVTSAPAPSDMLEAFSLLAHHGVPTRLLDWTTDWRVAVFFACSGHPDRDGELWCYDREQIDTNLPIILRDRGYAATQELEQLLFNDRVDNVLFEVTKKSTSRMKVQKAFHTVASEPKVNHFSLLAQMLAPNMGGHPLKKYFFRVVINRSAKPRLLDYVQKQDITAATLFPDLTGLGLFLTHQLRLEIEQVADVDEGVWDRLTSWWR